MKVFFAHQVIGEHHDRHRAKIARDYYAWLSLPVPADTHEEDLLIVDHADAIVERYPHGTWHTGGHGVLCGGADDDPTDCDICGPGVKGDSSGQRP